MAHTVRVRVNLIYVKHGLGLVNPIRTNVRQRNKLKTELIPCAH